MFSGKTDLSKLIELTNVDIQTQVANVLKDTDGKTVLGYQVQAQVTTFANNNEGEPKIVKKVSAFALDKNLEAAQDKALSKAQTLLGV